MSVLMGWNEYNNLAYKLYDELKGKNFDKIIAIARSGLILGVHLAHLLEIRDFACLEVMRTESDAINSSKMVPKIRYEVNMEDINGQNVLLIDDIVGEGATLRVVKNECINRGANVTTCVLTVNLNNFKGNDLDELVDYTGSTVRDWVIFPWCKED